MLTSVWTLYVGAAAGIIVMVLAAIIVGLLLKIRKSKAEFSLAYFVVLSILLTQGECCPVWVLQREPREP